MDPLASDPGPCGDLHRREPGIVPKDALDLLAGVLVGCHTPKIRAILDPVKTVTIPTIDPVKGMLHIDGVKTNLGAICWFWRLWRWGAGRRS